MGIRCKCCDSPEAKWDGVDWYCSDCSDAWREALYELEDWDDEDGDVLESEQGSESIS